MSWRAKAGIGLETEERLDIRIGDVADLVVLEGNGSVQSAALCGSYARSTVRHGRLVGRRTATEFVAFGPGRG